MVEHDPKSILAADWVIDLGPEGGDEGGEVVASGTPEEVASVAASHTGHFLAKYWAGTERTTSTTVIKTGPDDDGAIRIRGAREHNLKALLLICHGSSWW